jgi:predicted DNA binding CopG/RHH family protein
MTETREQLDEALNRLEDSITDLVRTRQQTELANELKEAARRIESRLAERDRRHYEGRFRLILWNAGILPEGH